MNKRTKAGQKKHDDSVLRSAEWYKKNGFITKADLPGWKKPKKIGGFIPDIIASDADQQKAFKKYSEREEGRTFRKKII